MSKVLQGKLPFDRESKKLLKEELMSNCGWTWRQVMYYRKPNVLMAPQDLESAGRIEKTAEGTYKLSKG